MSTPIGHALAGAAIGAVIARDPLKGAVAGAALAVAPDLDFIPGILVGEPARFHHGASHSLLFAVMAGVLAGLVAGPRWGIVGLLAYVSHLVLDYFTYDDSVPYGIPLWWPFSDATEHSVPPLLPQVVHSGGNPFGWHNVRLIGMELLIWGTLLVVVLWRRGLFLKRPPPAPEGRET